MMASNIEGAAAAPAPEDRHAYRGVDRALLLGFYRWLFWDKLIERIPRRITPNMITVFGETCAALTAVVAFGATRIPALHLVVALLLFIYVTGDNVDGPHARRTGQTSKLGELLDHGLDGLASCAVLLSSAITLGLDGPYLAAIAGLAALAFFTTFWAQFRTGLMVTPQMSAMEGVTGALLFQILVFALGEPAWLRFDATAVNPATIVVGALVLSYAVAAVTPIVRVARAGRSVVDTLPVAAIIAVIAAASRTTDAYRPVVALSLVIAELVCRAIIHRHQDDERGVVRPAHALLAVPWVIVAANLGSPAVVDACAWLGVAAAFASYAYTFGRGAAMLAKR